MDNVRLLQIVKRLCDQPRDIGSLQYVGLAEVNGFAKGATRCIFCNEYR